MTSRRFYRLHILGGLLLSLMAGPASADQTSERKSRDALPGVEGGYSIVTPAPEPLEAPAMDDGYFKVGDWDVRISGSVMFQIGASSADSDKRQRR
jgi:hypothetical protein